MSDSPPQSVSFDDRPRFRWVAPLCLGISVGAVLGILITFVSLRISGPMNERFAAEQFQIQQVILNNPSGVNLTINQDSTSTLGQYSSRLEGNSGIRRRIILQGTLPPKADRSAFVQQFETALKTELGRQGAATNGSGSSSTTSNELLEQSSEYTYYTGNLRQGQMDVTIRIVGQNISIVVSLAESR